MLPNGMLPTDYAFPRPDQRRSDGEIYEFGTGGMDLRTWLAGQALPGFAAAHCSPETAGAGAVAYADAALRHLSLPGETPADRKEPTS